MRLAEDGLGIRGCQRTRVSQMAAKGKQEVLGRIGKTNGICAPAAALQLTGVLRGVVGFCRFDLTEVGNRDAAFRKMRHDFERATHGLNEAPQIADVHICPVFHLGDGRLMHLEPRCQIRLRLLARFPQLRQRHFLL